ncbi:hypothetical protein Tco_0456595 [Tanacetum coccineum]
MVKGVTKKREKTSDTQSGKKKKEEKPTLEKTSILMLKPSIRSLRVDSNTPLVGFLGEESWPLGEVPLEVTIREGPLTITKTLTFVIVKSNSPHNLLLGRTTVQEMWIVVSTVHGAIKFHTPNDVGTIFPEHNS